ncbi:MAG: cell wall hydrolase [Candidatus Pacebacteria bacterium]|nr:cell wall hydrolase [Candidatus Paceibacterota bacterium]
MHFKKQITMKNKNSSIYLRTEKQPFRLKLRYLTFIVLFFGVISSTTAVTITPEKETTYILNPTIKPLNALNTGIDSFDQLIANILEKNTTQKSTIKISTLLNTDKKSFNQLITEITEKQAEKENKYNLNEKEQKILAAILYGESSPFKNTEKTAEEMSEILGFIINRSKKWNNTIMRIATQPNQFQAYHKYNPSIQYKAFATKRHTFKPNSLEDKKAKCAEYIIKQLINGNFKNPLNKDLLFYFHNKDKILIASTSFENQKIKIAKEGLASYEKKV